LFDKDYDINSFVRIVENVVDISLSKYKLTNDEGIDFAVKRDGNFDLFEGITVPRKEL